MEHGVERQDIVPGFCAADGRLASGVAVATVLIVEGLPKIEF